MTLKIRKGNKVHNLPVTLCITESRIWFDKQTFNKLLNDEIKAMRGYRWHGYDEPPIKKWSIENHARNVFQLQALAGNNPYAWFERPLEELTASDFNRPEYEIHGVAINGAQIDMVNRALTYHYQIWAAEQGLGKSLAAIEVMERSGKEEWWFIGPKSALASVEQEMLKWGVSGDIRLTTMTYEGLISKMRYDFEGLVAPDGIFFDESDNLKTYTAHRAIAAQAIADLIREQHGFDGYVILLSGTPSAKHPTDLWSQCEIAWPGFLREGNYNAFQMRYAIMAEQTNPDGTTFIKRIGWKEDEVAALPNRYNGLMTVYRKADWLKLPSKRYKTIRLEPSNKVLRVAKALTNIADCTMTALTWLRALSSGFQYTNTCVGDQPCSVCEGTGTYEFAIDGQTCPGCNGLGKTKKYERETKMVSTPKDQALREILDQHEANGRLVVAASFQGSIDRILKICKERGWAVACVDGRGWRCYDSMGNIIKNGAPQSEEQATLEHWRTNLGKTAFVGNPGSCRYGLTLTLAYTLVFYDNSFSAVHRLQMEDRIHRQSMDVTLG
ncbi:MAG: DEAD/DEAH box helicase, partial [Nitrososphaera sp.]|nr:DEAD/DEAH box helicase [Nitrososphaera sp.]